MTRRPNLEMTSTERRVRDAYDKLTKKHGAEPSLADVATELGDITRAGVWHALARMREKGFITAPKVTIIRPRLTAKGKRAG